MDSFCYDLSEERELKVEKLLKSAKNLIGAPYKYGAYLEKQSSKETMFDCSSFIQYVFKKIDINLPRSTILQATHGKEVPSSKIVMPGDLIFFEGTRGHYRHDLFPGKKIYIGHVALSIGGSRIIHACNNSRASGVVEQSLITFLQEPLYKAVLVKRVF